MNQSFNNKKRIVFKIVTFLMLVFIFLMSSRVDTGAHYKMYKVYDDGMVFGFLFLPGFDNMDWESRLNLAKAIDYPLRYTIHLIEYLILGNLIFCGFYVKEKWKSVYNFLLVISGCVLIFAGVDEWHQQFVHGQVSMYLDVFIEVAACYFGGLFTWLFVSKKEKI